MCTTYGTKMTGIARYARMLYTFWISVSRPKLCDKEVRDAADKRGKDLGAADFACGFCSAASFSETGVDFV
mgnify:CR=1 FL=1